MIFLAIAARSSYCDRRARLRHQAPRYDRVSPLVDRLASRWWPACQAVGRRPPRPARDCRWSRPPHRRRAVRRNRGNLVVGAPELEGAGALKCFRFEKHAGTERFIKHRRIDQRCADRNAGEPLCRSLDIGDGRKNGVVDCAHMARLALDAGCHGRVCIADNALDPACAARALRQ